jgi:hypothetical protein
MALPIAVYAYIARRDQELMILENAPPPELRLTIDLTRCVEELQGRAQALEAAMAQATAISEYLQRGIERERQQLCKVNEEHLRIARLNDLTPKRRQPSPSCSTTSKRAADDGRSGRTLRLDSCSGSSAWSRRYSSTSTLLEISSDSGFTSADRVRATCGQGESSQLVSRLPGR